MIENIFTEKWQEAKTVAQKKDAIQKQLGFIPSILYLDDEKDLLPIFENQINKLGLDSHVTSDYNEALLYANQFKDSLACIISDYKMPEVNGAEFRKMIIDETAHIPFFILSGYIDVNTILKSSGMGISAFLEKPFSTDKLVNFFRRKSVSQEILVESEEFLGKNEEFNVFWKKLFEKTGIDLYLVSSDQASPVKVELLDFDNESISIQTNNSLEVNDQEIFIKFFIINEGKKSKLLVKSKVVDCFLAQNNAGELYQVELKMLDIKSEDVLMINKTVQQRQELMNQYLLSAQKHKKE